MLFTESREESLQRVFSKKEKAERTIRNLSSLTVSGEDEEIINNEIREESLASISEANNEIIELKSKIEQDIGTKKVLMNQYNTEYKKLNIRLKIGEVNPDDFEKRKKNLQVKYSRLKKEVDTLSRLKSAESSADVGGYKEPPVSGVKGGISGGDIGQIIDTITSTGSNLSIGRSLRFSSTHEVITRKNTLIPLMGSVLGIIAIFLPWVVIDLSAFKNVPYMSQYMTLLNRSFSLFDIDSAISQISQYLRLFGNSVSGLNLNSGHWIELLVILVIPIAFSYFAEPKIRCIGHIVFGLIAVWILFGFYQEVQSVVTIINSSASLLDSFTSNNAISSALGQILRIGYGVYIEIIGVIMIISGGILELKE